ncbi:MAG: zinc-binding dehydrogenase [Caldilineaceae bacterium]
MQATAVVFTAANAVEVQTVQCPEPGAEDVVIRVTHSWISNGTEGSFLRGERIAGDTPRRPGDPVPFPIVAGYQKIGVVEWIGDAVTDLAVGETVFAATSKVDGMFSPRGGHVSPAVTPHDQIWKLPDGVDSLAFAGLVLTQVGYNCGVRAAPTIGDGALVFGDGMVGQWTAQTLAWRGADVLVVGRHADRLAKLPSSPHVHTVNEREDDWRQVAERRLPQGIQIAVDTAGSIPLVAALSSLVARGGHIVSAGFYGAEDQLALQPLRNREISLDFVSGWTRNRMDQTLRLIAAGYLQTLPLITHHFPVEQAAAAWDLITTRREPVLGVILDW